MEVLKAVWGWVGTMALAGGFLVFLGFILMVQGCGFEGDTYSGTVTQVDCGAATTTTGQMNCGSGSQTDDHHSEELILEEE